MTRELEIKEEEEEEEMCDGEIKDMIVKERKEGGQANLYRSYLREHGGSRQWCDFINHDLEISGVECLDL